MPTEPLDWSQQRVFVTGASGFVGSWLVKALIAKQAQVVVLIRDLDQHSELIRSGAINQVSVIHGCLEDYACLERAINKFETNVVFARKNVIPVQRRQFEPQHREPRIRQCAQQPRAKQAEGRVQHFTGHQRTGQRQQAGRDSQGLRAAHARMIFAAPWRRPPTANL